MFVTIPPPFHDPYRFAAFFAGLFFFVDFFGAFFFTATCPSLAVGAEELYLRRPDPVCLDQAPGSFLERRYRLWYFLKAGYAQRPYRPYWSCPAVHRHALPSRPRCCAAFAKSVLGISNVNGRLPVIQATVILAQRLNMCGRSGLPGRRGPESPETRRPPCVGGTSSQA